MIKIPPCDLPMVPLVPMAVENVQGFLVTIGKNGTNSTIGRFSDFTIGRTPNVALANLLLLGPQDSHRVETVSRSMCFRAPSQKMRNVRSASVIKIRVRTRSISN